MALIIRPYDPQGDTMQTIGCDPYKGLIIYKDGQPVAEFNDVETLASLIKEASKALWEKVNEQ